LTIELTPAQGCVTAILFELTWYIRLESNPLRSRAHRTATPKDTLLALNTCIRRITAALQCARPCIALYVRIPSVGLSALWYEDAAFESHYPINFIVKHQTFSRRRALRRWETRRFRSMSPNRRHHRRRRSGNIE